MFCCNCGKPLGDTDLFCANCGAPVQERQPEWMIQPVYETEEKPKKKNGWIVAILSSVAVVVLILLFVLIKISDKKVQKSFQNYRVEDGTDTDESDFGDYFSDFEDGEDYSF
ncbi:MAG: zinc ribbon domain-containing protein [Eubacterium sp.]|nr:zinc ribbon domain-containing protein [Eubacterium sp.]